MRRKIADLIAALLCFCTVILLGCWAFSYFTATTLEYVYFHSMGDLVEDKIAMHCGTTKAWDLSVAGGSIFLCQPYVDGDPYGLRLKSDSYSNFKRNLQGTLPGSRFGFCARLGEMMVPVWPLAYALGVIPALYFSRRHGNRFKPASIRSC